MTKSSAIRRFVIPAAPQPKQRPRLGKGRVRTPAKTRRFEALVASVATGEPIDGQVYVRITAVFPRPKSRPRGVAKETWNTGWRLLHTGRSDIDNLAKSVLDGMKRIITDDRRVVALEAVKVCAAIGEDACVEVEVGPATSWGRSEWYL